MAVSDCIFCKIISGEIPSTKIFENDFVVAFNDIHPQAPVHFLVIPKKHISSMNELGEQDIETTGQMLYHASRLAQDRGIGNGGYRQIINCGEDGGQIVQHLHLHILGGRRMGKMG